MVTAGATGAGIPPAAITGPCTDGRRHDRERTLPPTDRGDCAARVLVATLTAHSSPPLPGDAVDVGPARAAAWLAERGADPTDDPRMQQ